MYTYLIDVKCNGVKRINWWYIKESMNETIESSEIARDRRREDPGWDSLEWWSKIGWEGMEIGLGEQLRYR